MTTNDKTGDQLMASIRKTKTGAAATDTETGGSPQKVATAPATAEAETKPAATGSTPRRPRVAKKKVAPSGSAGYQSPGRVWPD